MYVQRARRLLIFPINNELAIMMALNMHRGAPANHHYIAAVAFVRDASAAIFSRHPPAESRHKKRQRRNP